MIRHQVRIIVIVMALAEIAVTVGLGVALIANVFAAPPAGCYPVDMPNGQE